MGEPILSRQRSAMVKYYHPTTTANLKREVVKVTLDSPLVKLSTEVTVEGEEEEEKRVQYIKLIVGGEEREREEEGSEFLWLPVEVDPWLEVKQEEVVVVPNWVKNCIPLRRRKNSSEGEEKLSILVEEVSLGQLPQISRLHFIPYEILPEFPRLPLSFRNFPNFNLLNHLKISLNNLPVRVGQLIRVIILRQPFLFKVSQLNSLEPTQSNCKDLTPYLFDKEHTELTISLNYFHRSIDSNSYHQYNHCTTTTTTTTTIYRKEKENLMDMIDWSLGTRKEFHSFNRTLCPVSASNLITGPPGIGKRHFVRAIQDIFRYTKEETVLVLNIDLSKLLIQVQIQSSLDSSSFLEDHLEELDQIVTKCGDELSKYHRSILLTIIGLDHLLETTTNDEMISTLQKILLQYLAVWTNQSNIYILAVCTDSNKLSRELRHFLGEEIGLKFPDSDQRYELIKTWVGNCTMDIDRLVNATHSYSPADLLFLVNTLNSFRGPGDSDLSQMMASLSVEDSAQDTISLTLAETAWQRKAGIASRPPAVTFDRLGGYDGVKQRLRQLLCLLGPNPNPLGLAKPSGLLLVGPAGCGKTQFAQAMAHHVGFHFISVKGPELFSSNFGGTEKAIRTLFQTARSLAPCTLFIDELDAIGVKRGWSSGDDGAGGVTARVLSTLLNELDGVQVKQSVFVIACSALPDGLDDALIRPGRFDTTILVDLPTEQDRIAIIDTLLLHDFRNVTFALDPSAIAQLASCTPRFTPADLIWLLREATLDALDTDLTPTPPVTLDQLLTLVDRRQRPSVSLHDLAKFHRYR